jgi:hypothetical protein
MLYLLFIVVSNAAMAVTRLFFKWGNKNLIGERSQSKKFKRGVWDRLRPPEVPTWETQNPRF